MSHNRSAYVKIFASALVLSSLPAAVCAGSKQTVADSSGNTYGIVRIEGSAGPADANAALGNIVRYENAMAALAAGRQNGRHGMAIRLRPHSGEQNCSQVLRGTASNNLLDGSKSACNEAMYGLGGSDILIGGSGSNTLDGGRGADIMTGGSGANRFVYERAADSTVDAVDTITDFNSGDTLDLTGLARTSGVTLTFIGWSEFSGVAGQVNYNIMEYWKCDQAWHCSDQYVTVLGVDLTGSGTSDFCIDLLGRHYLTSANLELGPNVAA